MLNFRDICLRVYFKMYELTFLSALLTTALGTVVKDNSTAIINGNLANIEDFPYYAYLSFKNYYCGGAFIEQDLVLTAAHCLYYTKMKVYPGISSLKNLKGKRGYAVKSAVPHPAYSDDDDDNDAFDIALIKLKRKIKLSEKAQLIELATEAPPVGEEASVVGFGKMQCQGLDYCDEYAEESDHLRSADIVITAVKEDGTVLTQSHDEMSTCYGDSGGPIVYDGKLLGVVAGGESSDCTGFDTQAPVYTVLDWIKKTKAKM